MTGFQQRRRYVLNVRDSYGLGADCPRLDFEQASVSVYHSVGDINLVSFFPCAEILCTEVGNNTRTNTLPLKNESLELQEELLEKMSQVPRNGFLRNHPMYDGWNIHGRWVHRTYPNT